MKTIRHTVKLVTVCLAIAGLLTACQPQAAAPTATVAATAIPSPTETPPQPPTPSAEEIRTAIVNGLLTLYTRSNRMEVTTAPSEGQAQTNVIEFIPPDRKRIVGEGAEYIVVGDKVYQKTEGGEWEETPLPASTFLGDGAVTADTLGATISDAQLARQDTLGGQAVLVYSYSSTTQSGDVELHSQTELWIGVDDGLPVQMVVDGDILSATTDPAGGESSLQVVNALTTTTIDFDAPISIEPPIEN